MTLNIGSVVTAGSSSFFWGVRFLTDHRPIKRGALAKSAGCNIETIRYYENIGLLNQSERTTSGHRVYSPEDQARLGFILRGRELGFSDRAEVESLVKESARNGYRVRDLIHLVVGSSIFQSK